MQQQASGSADMIETPGQATAEAGFGISGPFRDLYERLGPEVCGPPISDPVDMDGTPAQFFERVIMEEYEPGHVRLRAIGRELLEQYLREMQESVPRQAIGLDSVVDVIHEMPLHPAERYDRRPLENIRYLVIHHTRTTVGITPHELARQHVERLGWPGMGYHFVVAADGTIFQTNDLTTVSFHARQFNPTAVGIALAGDFSSQGPPPAQMDSACGLCAYLLDELNLPAHSVRGHRDLLFTKCPGDQWVEGEMWRETFLSRIRGMVRVAE